MRARMCAVWACSFCVAGCIGGSEPIGRERVAVRMGVEDAGDPAVVSIYKEAVVLCTGTLVTPRVIVTAAHCLHPDMLNGTPIIDLEVRVGTSAFFPDGKLTIAEGTPHPDFDPSSLDLDGNPDVGVLRLAEPAVMPGAAEPIAPLGTHHESIPALLVPGAPLRVVGYGVTAYGAMDYATKRQTNAAIDAIDVTSIELTPAVMCAGDSGGPYLFSHEGREYVVAVHSNGNCTSTSEGTPIATVYDSFVLPFIERDCVADGACLALCKNVVDPDCASDAEGGGGGSAGGDDDDGGDDDGGGDGETDETDDGGCTVEGASTSPPDTGWLFVAFAATAVRLRRRRG
jgi:MYXO-CTERM domain-containing protein